LYAAQQCYEKRATGIRRHTYSLAFAITDYKLQGKTLPRLLLSLDDNGPAPPVTLAKLYVLISRVGTLDGLRFLPPMPADTVLKRHAGKAPNSDLLMWERGYDGEGRWVDALAVAARKEQDDAAAAAEAARTTQRKREAKERAKAAAKQKNAAGTAARAQTKRAAGGSAPQCPLGVCSGAPTTVTNNIIDDR
jgi:phosphoglycolate phosphatase-like HAD superfamily hydrolase